MFRPFLLVVVGLFLASSLAACASNRRRSRGDDAGPGPVDAATGVDGGGGADAGVGDGGVPLHCGDGLRNGDESQADCGGSCAPCPDGALCRSGADCVSGVCGGGFCLVPTCEDGVQNGSETGLDCGSGCPGCAGGEPCEDNDDCVSLLCESGACAETSCGDGVQNADETDVDCGGAVCEGCAGGDACTVDADCASVICADGTCTTATCMDAVRNQDESDADCGGTICAPCTVGGACAVAADCDSSVCDGGVCQAPTCMDGVQNADETDADCGGGTCDPCAAGGACVATTDCVSGVCTGGICQAPTCMDGVVNGGETDVDCGGATACPRCADGLACTADTDCVAGVCPMERMRCGLGPVCTAIDGFETGSWPYSPWVVESAGGSASTSAAHDGTYGLVDPDWHYRTDVTVGMTGDRLRMWARASSSGRAYLGFGATASGASSFVMGPNTNELLFQTNSGYGYSAVTRSTVSFTSGQWYLLEVEFLGGGMVTGTVYQADGVTVVSSLSWNFGTSFSPAGVAIRSFGTTYVDTIELCR